jgi:hypothetical protein
MMVEPSGKGLILWDLFNPWHVNFDAGPFRVTLLRTAASTELFLIPEAYRFPRRETEAIRAELPWLTPENLYTLVHLLAHIDDVFACILNTLGKLELVAAIGLIVLVQTVLCLDQPCGVKLVGGDLQ